MYLNYSELAFDKNGLPEQPELLLKTMSGDVIGTIPGVHNLKLNIKFAEPSEISFDVPAVLDGEPNWIYDKLTGYKVVWTKTYGIYILMNPEMESDGIEDVKHIKGYSLEKQLSTKKFFLEEGTFKFYNEVDENDSNTIIGRILEIAVGWGPGTISPALAQRYRTFDEYDDYLLDFLYNDAPEKYHGVFVFDPYTKTISAYDADETLETLPIYLDFDNLVEDLSIEEITEDVVTAIRPYGADDLDIRDVNPIGTNWIYNLDWFIENGDIPNAIADKWVAWQNSVIAEQERYRGLVALRASTTASMLAKKAKMVDIEGEIESYIAQQNIYIQMASKQSTEEGVEDLKEQIRVINTLITNKRAERAELDAEIASLEYNLDPEDEQSYVYQIQSIVDNLSFKKFFTDEELEVLQAYIIEDDITEDTFVASDINDSPTGSFSQLDGERVLFRGVVAECDLRSEYQKMMYSLSGGVFFIGNKMTGDVIRGTLELADTGKFVMSMYIGASTIDNESVPSGIITITGNASGFTDNVTDFPDDRIPEFVERFGTAFSFNADASSMYITTNVSDYQKYSVQMELYDFALDALNDIAYPTYEFEVDSGNFVFAKEFAPFRNQLQLGKGVYLNVGHKELITPYIIELKLDFEDYSKFDLVFSNKFKRHDSVNTLKDMIEKSYSTSRNFDASKYVYNQAARQSSAVSQFMSSALDAAKNKVLAGTNEDVRIDSAGIHVGGNSPVQIRIVNGMIAMTDDNWETANLAIGQFTDSDGKEHSGVNADVIGGKLLIGNNLVLENETDEGVSQFKVDSSGAWLNNSTFILQKDDGGKIILDPKYGILGGTKDLFTTNGTTVTPSFIGEDGTITLDDDGMPTNTNFYLDVNTGNAYLRGQINATGGEIAGFTLAEDYMHTGSGSNYVAVNGSGTNEESAYAFWAGNEDPDQAPFWVKKDGSIHAKNGDFSGTLSAAKLSGNLIPNNYTGSVPDDASDGGWLIGCGINVGNGKFQVDKDGNVTMTGDIQWSSTSSPTKVLYARTALAVPTSNYNNYPSTSSTEWHTTHNAFYDYYAAYTYDGGQTWDGPIQIMGRDGRDGSDGSDANVPSYIHTSYMSSTKVIGPEIYGGQLYATGMGTSDGEGPAFYVTAGGVYGSGSSTYVSSDRIVGSISYDTGGDGQDSSVTRMIIQTYANADVGYPAIKLESAGNISFEAGKTSSSSSSGGMVYFHSKAYFGNGIHLYQNTSFGWSLPSASGYEVGDIFFLIE